MIVFLDTGILGLLANPNKQGEAADCEQWLLGLLSKGVSVLTSDICCLLYTSPSPRDLSTSRMPSSA